MRKKAKREPIYFNEVGFNHELKNYTNKKSYSKQLQSSQHKVYSAVIIKSKSLY